MNGGLFMLSSAAANAFMCVISRVMRNCKASLVPASVVKSMSRFGVLAIELHWLQMQAGKRADDLQMAQFFRADIHQQIFPFRILAVEALHGVLHRPRRALRLRRRTARAACSRTSGPEYRRALCTSAFFTVVHES